MKKIISILIILSNIFILAQNHDSNIWGGLSVSLSDNLDAIDLNPAGLGVDRGKQFGINIQQSNFDSQHTNYHIYSMTTRWKCGGLCKITMMRIININGKLDMEQS